MNRVFKTLKKIMLVTALVIVALVAIVWLYMQHTKFGKAPAGQQHERMKQSPNYRDGVFHNIEPTPSLTEGYSMPRVFFEFLFKKVDGRSPNVTIPSTKTNLLALPADSNVLVWFGHSSYYMQVEGKRILVDPVFSGNASPVPGSNKAFKGTDRYSVDDIPAIDLLIITHDHYDHADYETLIQLNDKVQQVVTGLGVGAHLQHWGIDSNKITECDWNETVEHIPGLVLHALTARHFSGRNFKRNTTLWMSFLLQTPHRKIYIGGDSGYGKHFANIGAAHGPIDLAILENGQYDIKWKYIHMLPEEVLIAGKDLQAARVFPVHSGKFAMANHTWNEPLREVTWHNRQYGLPLVTPIIGQVVQLDNNEQEFTNWWE